MRHRIDQCGSQLLALPGGFHLMSQLLGRGALQTDRHQIRDALEHRIRHTDALQRDAADGFGPQSNSGNQAQRVPVREGGAAQSCVPELIVEAVEIGGTASMELPRTPVVKDGGAKSERLGELPNQLTRERVIPARQKYRAAESVQAFEIPLAL